MGHSAACWVKIPQYRKVSMNQIRSKAGWEKERERPEIALALHNTQQLIFLSNSAWQRHKLQFRWQAAQRSGAGSVPQNRFWLCDPGKRHGFCAKLSFPILKMGIAPPEFIMPIIYYNLLNNYYFDGYIVCFQKGRERKKECGPGRGNFKYKGMLQGVQKTMFQS